MSYGQYIIDIIDIKMALPAHENSNKVKNPKTVDEVVVPKRTAKSKVMKSPVKAGASAHPPKTDPSSPKAGPTGAPATCPGAPKRQKSVGRGEYLRDPLVVRVLDFNECPDAPQRPAARSRRGNAAKDLRMRVSFRAALRKILTCVD